MLKSANRYKIENICSCQRKLVINSLVSMENVFTRVSVATSANIIFIIWSQVKLKTILDYQEHIFCYSYVFLTKMFNVIFTITE